MKFNIFTQEVDTNEALRSDFDDMMLFLIRTMNPELGVTKVETSISKKEATVTFYRQLKYGILGNNISDYDLALVFGLDPDKFQVNPIGDSSRYCCLFCMFPWRDRHCYGDLEQAEKYCKNWLCKGVKSVSITPSDDKLTIIIK